MAKKSDTPKEEHTSGSRNFLPQELLAERAVRINERVGLKAHRQHKQLERGIGSRGNIPTASAHSASVMDFAQQLAGFESDITEETPAPAATKKQITPEDVRAKRQGEKVPEPPPVQHPVVIQDKPTQGSPEDSFRKPIEVPTPMAGAVREPSTERVNYPQAPKPVHVSGGPEAAKNASFAGTGSEFLPKEITQIIKHKPKKK